MTGTLVSLQPTRAGKPARRPFVFMNMSMTADGKIATANRRVASFGSRHDLEHLYELRATADAVMCGARTLEAGDVTLGIGGARHQRARLRRGLEASHLRILVTGRATLDPAAPVFRRRFSPIIVLTTQRAAKSRREALRAVADEVVVCAGGEVDWAAALQHLQQRWGVKRLLCEGGADLNDALFRAGLVDELHLTICPFVFGGRGAPTIAEGVGVSRLAEAARFRLKARRRVGDELFCVFERGQEVTHEPGRGRPRPRHARFTIAKRGDLVGVETGRSLHATRPD